MAQVITKKGAALPLHDQGNTTFGLNADVAVTVAQAYEVADLHFTITQVAGQYVLKDLESGLGTRVNGESVTSHVLVHGDRIQAGKLELRFSNPAHKPEKARQSTNASPAGQAASGKEKPTSKKLLSFSIGRRKRPKLVLPVVKKKPLPKPLIKREVIRIPVKPDPNNPPRTIVNRLLGRTKQKKRLPELKLESINEKIEPKAPKPVVTPKKPAAKQSKITPIQSKTVEKPAPQVQLPPLPKEEVKSPSISVSSSSESEKPKSKAEVIKKPKRRPISAIVRSVCTHYARAAKGGVALLNSGKTCAELVTSSVGKLRRRLTAPIVAFPGKLARYSKQVIASAKRLTSWVIATAIQSLNVVGPKLLAAKATASNLVTALAAGARNLRASVAEKLQKPRVLETEQPEASTEPASPPALPALESVPLPDSQPEIVSPPSQHETPVLIQLNRQEGSRSPRSSFVDTWMPSVAAAAALTIVAGTILYDSQNEQFLYGFISKYTESTRPSLMQNDNVISQPAVASLKHLPSEYPVSENKHLSGIWIAVETVQIAPVGPDQQRFHPGSAFEFGPSGILKTMTGPGRKDGQPLSDVEALGLHVHFQASYEILGAGLVLCHTENGEILLSAHREREGLALSLLEPNTHEPVASLFCLKNERLEGLSRN